MTASDNPTLLPAGESDSEPAPDDEALDDWENPSPAEPVAPRTRRRLPRFGIPGLSLLVLLLLVLVVLDRRPTPRPLVEVVDQGGLATVEPAAVAAARLAAAQLGYPVTLALADRPVSRGNWERSLGRLAQPDRLVIAVSVDDRAIVVARGAALPLTVSEELAIRSAGQAPARAGDPARALDFALTQARLIGSPYPAPSPTAPLDLAAAQLALSVLAPCLVFGLALGAVRYRFRVRAA